MGLLNVSGGPSGPDKLWYSIGSYSPLAAEAILKNSACVSGSHQAGNCAPTPTVPVGWSSPANVASSSGAITADALVAQGSGLYAAATLGGSTNLYSSTNGGAGWNAMASGIGGMVEGLVTNGSDVVVLTLSGLTFTSTVYTLGGTLVGSSSPLSLTGSATSVPGASFAVAPVGMSWSYAIAAGVLGPHHVEVATSSDGIHYTSFSMVANINTTVPNAALSSIGATRLYPSGGIPGQVALTAIGSGMLLLYTTRVSGEVSANLLSSPSGGTSWLGPYRVGSTPGTVQDPQLAPSLAGTVYATWRDVANGSGTAVEAILAPNGVVLEPPAAVPGSSLSGLSPIGGPAIAVDGLQRPLILWPAVNPGLAGEDVLAYSGGFFPASVATTRASQEITDPLVPGDFAPGAPSNALQVLESNVNSVVSSLDNDISSANSGQESGYCNSQNATLLGLYANLTTIPLSYTGSNTVCASFTFAQLHPRVSYISPILGPFAPNSYLAVYADWVLEAVGVDVTASPLQAAATAVQPPQDEFSASPEWFAPPTPVTNNAAVQGPGWDPGQKTETVTVTPTVFSPTALQLSVSSNPIPTFWYNTSSPCYYGKAKVAIQYTNWTTFANKTWFNVSLNNGTTHSFLETSTFVSSIFLTNLTPLNNGSSRYFWQASFSVAYATTEYTTLIGQGKSYCTAKPGLQWIQPATPASLGPISTSGGFWTELTLDPSYKGSSLVTAGGSKGLSLTVGWTNTAYANDNVSIVNETTQIDPQSAGPITTSPEDYPFSIPGTMGNTYTLTLTGQSPAGGWTGAELPAFSAGSYGSSPAETAVDTCTFTLSPPSETLSQDGATSNIESTSATITWEGTTTGSPGPGFITYYAVGTGVNLTDDEVSSALVGPGTYEYVAQLHGLYPWTTYSAMYGITTYPSGEGGGCLTDVSQYSVPQFLTNYTLPLWEQDQPYDSLSDTGGGAAVGWELPAWFLAKNPTWVSGALNYTNSSGVSTGIPLNPSTITSTASAGFEVILQLGQPNTVYTVNVSLVYEIGQTKYYAFSPLKSFVYLRDTSGDGLTDTEKDYGWSITYENTYGAWTNEPVWANPYLFATNGLVNDYVEKEYGLNPNTLDTAGSHLLDTWNLTFILSGSSCPADFQCWYENTSNPFGYNVTPSGLNHHGWPVANNTTYAAHWTSSGLQDDNPYDAEVLWNNGALGVLQSLIASENVGWLRGVIMGGYNGELTLTVWGKLSWGANPLAASTPRDGIPDGERVDPLYDLGLEFQSVDANLTGLGNQGGTIGYAVRVFDNYTDDSWRARYLDNWSAPGFWTQSSVADITNYVTTLPVTQTAQRQEISLEVSENLTGWPQPAYINGSGTEVYETYDLVHGGSFVVNVAGTHSGGRSTLYGVFREVPMGGKAPTWLWIPTDNSTVNSLPTGLQRYTGEQSFDLVVVNTSTAVSSDPIPLPWGGTTSGLTLSTGMNDILIPREQFLASPLGQAIFLGRNTSFNASRALPLVGSTEQAYISGFGGSNLMVDLGAYWQNRAISSGPGNITGSYETGTPQFINGNQPNPLVVQVLATSSATGSNSGGLPSNPTLYNGSDTPSALQSIVTLNITSTATFDLLLAALLDNTTGGANSVNGTLESVTYQVGFLGLNPTVLNGISNGTDPNDGLYGPPASVFPPPQPSGFWGNMWNAATSFVTNPLGTVLSLVDTVWNAATAAFTYLNHLAHEAVAVGAQILARAASTLVSIGKTILSALDQLLNYLLQLVTSLLKTITQPISNAMKSYAWSVESALGHAQNDTAATGTLEAGDANAVWTALSGPVFLVALGLGTVVVTALTVLSSIDIGPSFLVEVLVGLLIGTLTGLAMEALLNTVGSAFSTLESSSIYVLESFFNSTVGTQLLGGSGIQPATGGGSNQPAWTTAALVIGTLFEFQLGFPLALYELNQKLSGPTKAFLAAAISLALDLVGIVFFIVGLTEPVPLALLVLGLGIGVFGFEQAFAQFKSPTTVASVKPILEFDIILQAGNVAGALYGVVQAAT